MTKSRPIQGKPAGLREPISVGEISYLASMYTLDQAYWYYGGTSAAVIGDLCATAYAKKYGVTMSQVEDAMNTAAMTNRANAVINPLATQAKIDFQQEAIANGFKNAQEYMKSDFNRKIGLIMRLFHGALVVDGASALIVCPTEMAKSFSKRPIDVLGFGSAAEITYHEVDAVWEMEKISFNQAYEMAGITPDEIDYMYVHDCFVAMHLTSTEAGGYFKPGEAWRAILDGRTAIKGDRPLSTTGGRTSMGHAFAATGGAEITEAVRQMRGECGVRQIHPEPEVSVVHNMGGGMHCNVVVLRSH